MCTARNAGSRTQRPRTTARGAVPCSTRARTAERPPRRSLRPTLVVRSGGGRAGESFLLRRERTRIGRSPECEVFLDDVTVSRNHAVVLNAEGSFCVDDQGSL